MAKIEDDDENEDAIPGSRHDQQTRIIPAASLRSVAASTLTSLWVRHHTAPLSETLCQPVPPGTLFKHKRMNAFVCVNDCVRWSCDKMHTDGTADAQRIVGYSYPGAILWLKSLALIWAQRTRAWPSWRGANRWCWRIPRVAGSPPRSWLLQNPVSGWWGMQPNVRPSPT